jgi:hypothetical protein
VESINMRLVMKPASPVCRRFARCAAKAAE